MRKFLFLLLVFMIASLPALRLPKRCTAVGTCVPRPRDRGNPDPD